MLAAMDANVSRREGVAMVDARWCRDGSFEARRCRVCAGCGPTKARADGDDRGNCQLIDSR